MLAINGEITKYCNLQLLEVGILLKKVFIMNGKRQLHSAQATTSQISHSKYEISQVVVSPLERAYERPVDRKEGEEEEDMEGEETPDMETGD